MESKLEKKSKPLLIIAMILASFVLIVSLASLYTERVVSCGMAQTCTIPLPFLIPIIASVSLFVGSLMGYLAVGKIHKTKDNFKKSAEVIKKLLNEDEWKILTIISKKNEISQAKIVQSSGLSRLKVFRIIEKLREREVLEKHEKDGKLRIIKIDEELRELFNQ